MTAREMPEEQPETPERPPAHHQPPRWPWLLVRTGLQVLLDLLPEQQQGLRLAAQALLVAGDLAINALEKRR
jgi:hypothetical protein